MPGFPDHAVPALRLRTLNRQPLRSDGDFVLYWMISQRRCGWNYALEHAIAMAARLAKPLLVVEALRCAYPWASARFHHAVIAGMRDQARALAGAGIAYHPYLEPTAGAGRGLIETLASRACLVVSDRFPCFFLPRMVAAVAGRLPVRFDEIDGNGIMPLAAVETVPTSAYAYRRLVQRQLPSWILQHPQADPLAALARSPLPSLAALPAAWMQRWPRADAALADPARALVQLPIDHSVAPVALAMGERASAAALDSFLTARLDRYGEGRSHPDDAVASGLSPALHWGHCSAHQVLHRVLERFGWDPGRLGEPRLGAKAGWWGVSAAAESFLDQLVVWRDLGFHFSAHHPDHDRFESLPAWARATLNAHRSDPRPQLYDLATLTAARTTDTIWNAAQRQLVRDGVMHNYLRMLWGKKILEWSPDPEQAIRTMFELNNRFALDGRDPNSSTGIMWCLGRFDRPWAPQRPIFGSIRYMSSANTARKLHLRDYLERYAA